MKKLLIIIAGALLLSSACHISAFSFKQGMWFLNLTSSPASFNYKVGAMGFNKNKSFDNIPAKSKSNKHDTSGKSVELRNRSPQLGTFTVIKRKNGKIEVASGSIYDSKEVKKAIREDLGAGDPKDLIKNW